LTKFFHPETFTDIKVFYCLYCLETKQNAFTRLWQYRQFENIILHVCYF